MLIYILEDEENIRELEAFALKNSGWDTECFESPAEFYKALSSQIPDLILLDIMLPGVIIGLTIVAMGTSAPELAVSTSAAIKGSNEIAVSNVTGSNIFNLLGVLGICAMIRPLPIDKTIMKRDFPISIGVSLLPLIAIGIPMLMRGNITSAAMSSNVGKVSRLLSIILLLIFAVYITMLIINAKKNQQQDDTVAESELMFTFQLADRLSVYAENNLLQEAKKKMMVLES
jgi:Ca2+/Na+ antiporter